MLARRLAGLALVVGAGASGCIWPGFGDPFLREAGAGEASVEDARVDVARVDGAADVQADRAEPHDAPADIASSPDVPIPDASDSDAGMTSD